MSFEISEFEQPGIGTGNQDTTVTAVAYCAPASIDEKAHAAVSSTVFGETVPPA